MKKNTNLKKKIDRKRGFLGLLMIFFVLSVISFSAFNPSDAKGLCKAGGSAITLALLPLAFRKGKEGALDHRFYNGGGGAGETEKEKEERKFMEKVASEVKSLVNTILKDAKFEDNEAFKALKALTEGSITKSNFEKLEKECEKLGLEVKSLKEKAAGKAEQNWVDGLKDALTGIKEKIDGKAMSDICDIKAAAVMVESTNLVSTTTGSAYLPMPTLVPGVISVPRNRPVFMENFDVSTIGTPKIVWINETNPTGDAEMTAEGATKPLADFKLTTEDMSCKKVAVRFNVSEEMLDDISYLLSEIQTKGIIRTKLVIDGQLLSGDGTGQNLKGIKTYAPGYTMTALNGTVLNPNFYDAIGAMIQQIINASDEWYPNVIFMNPLDKYTMEHTKTTTEEYAILQLQLTQGTLYGCKVVVTNQIPQGDCLVGDFSKAHVRIYKDIAMKMGYNGDDFKNNMVTIILEARLLQYVSDNEKTAFVYDQLADVITAIESAPNP